MAISVNYQLNLEYPVSILVSVLDNDVEIASEEQFFPFDKVPTENLTAFSTTLENSCNNILNNLISLSYEDKINQLYILINMFKLKSGVDNAISSRI